MTESWFALWTRSRHEQVVREQLEQKHIEAFLPTVTRWSRWKDRKKKIDWPLFPGYCFARFNLRERLPVLKCTGVVNIISFEGEPAPIPEREIDGIRRLVESDLAFDPCPMIREGMMVEVVHGPLDRRDRSSDAEERQGPARAVGRSDRAGGQRRSRRRGCPALLTDDDEDRLRRSHVAVCRGPDGGDDGHGVPPAGEASGRLWTRRDGDGVVGRPGPRDRSDARIRGIHRRRAPGLDSDFRRRSREDGRRCADRRGHGRGHRRCEHGLSGAQDLQAQRRMQPDARSRARGARGRCDDQGRQDSRSR